MWNGDGEIIHTPQKEEIGLGGLRAEPQAEPGVDVVPCSPCHSTNPVPV